MMTEFSGLYCCGLSAVFTFPTGAVQLRSVFAIPTEFSTAVVCFYCPARLYSCGLGLFLLSRLNSVQPCGSLFLLSRLSVVSEFSTARHWIQYCGCGLFSLSPDGIEYSFVFRPTAVPTESSLVTEPSVHWRYQVLRISDWLTLWTFWTVLFQVFWQKCLSHRDAAEISLRTFPTQSRFGKARQNEKTYEYPPLRTTKNKNKMSP